MSGPRFDERLTQIAIHVAAACALPAAIAVGIFLVVLFIAAIG
jgi:hypothetical protein